MTKNAIRSCYHFSIFSDKIKQLFYEVKRAVEGNVPVFPINKIGGGEMITPDELLSEIVRKMKLLA